LERAACLVGPVRKIPVVCPGDSEHSHKVQPSAKAQGCGGAGDPNQRNQRQMQENKRNNHDPTGKERTNPSGFSDRHQCGAGMPAPGCCAADGNLLGNPNDPKNQTIKSNILGLGFGGNRKYPPDYLAEDDEVCYFLPAVPCRALRMELKRRSSARRRASQGFS